MTAEHKKHHHHHHHHQNHQHKKMVTLKSVERIVSLPVVESAHAYYERIKNSNPLIRWSLMPAETGVWLAVGSALPVVNYFEKPVTAVDSIVCRGLDVIEANLPIVTYPPDLVYNMTKDYVTSNVVAPVLKRADSVKQLSISGASMAGEIAAERLNHALDTADKYVDKYLPDIADPFDATDGPNPGNSDGKSKTAQTIQHVNKFGRKLQRRLTRRTIAEAKALKQQGADTVRCFVYLVDLLARDPKAFMEKFQQMWAELSKDEPENQVPPANLEQLIAMLTREMARRIVHLTNYTGARALVLSHHSVQAAHVAALNAVWWADYLIKAMHLESAMDVTATQITKFHHYSIHLVELVVELIRNLKTESQKSVESRPAIASEPQPPQIAISAPKQLVRTTSTTSTTSSASNSSLASSTVTPTTAKHPSPSPAHNGKLYEPNQEAVAS